MDLWALAAFAAALPFCAVSDFLAHAV